MLKRRMDGTGLRVSAVFCGNYRTISCHVAESTNYQYDFS